MAALRVLHVIGGLELGGAETLLYRLVTAPSPEFEHEIVCLGPPDWYSPLLEERGIKVHHLGVTTTLSSFPAFAKLRRLIREARPDLIQSWMYLANVLSSLASQKTPVVWGVHGSTLEHLGGPSYFCARAGGLAAGGLADFVVNCSKRSAELHSRLGYARAPNAVIHNGYDPAAFFPDEQKRGRTRAALGFNDDTFLIGSITRWHSQKDIPNLLSAIRKAADGGAEFRCLLIGRGMDRANDQLTAEMRKQDCEDLAIPLGSRDDVQDLARALDLHILSSSGGEAFPNVVAETMLSGTPNVATDVGDSTLMVRGTGWTVPPRDPRQLADAIADAWREWSRNQARWQERRQSARRLVVENYTFDRMVMAYRDVWRTVAMGRRNKA
jgi:glycosyltransferase involved in cell wall biosynthesis